MADFAAIPLFTDSYLADTRHLTTEEHGAYLLLMFEAWRRPDCALPDDDALLARLAGLSPDRWKEVKAVVMAFWSRDGRRKSWTQKRLLKERRFVAQKSASQRDKAASRWKNTKKDDAAALPDRCRSDAPTPTPTPSIEREAKASPKMDDDFDEFWSAVPKKVAKAAAVKAYRSARKIADAKTILEGMRRYAASRAGEDPQFTAHPATWLNAGRWADVASTPIAVNLRNPQIGDQFTAKDGRLMEWCGIDGWLEVRS